MWPHYTQEKGFRIKFNTEKLEKSIQINLGEKEGLLGLYPMNYTKQLEVLDISDYEDFLLPFFYSFTVKDDNWDYEKEWRFLISKAKMGVPYSKIGFSPLEDVLIKKENRYVYYDKDIVEEITLGWNFFNGRDFNVNGENEKIIQLQLKPKTLDDPQQDNPQQILLNHITSKLSDKVYLSCVKCINDSNGKKYLVRGKEKIQIIEKLDGNYDVIRTGEIH